YTVRYSRRGTPRAARSLVLNTTAATEGAAGKKAKIDLFTACFPLKAAWSIEVCSPGEVRTRGSKAFTIARTLLNCFHHQLLRFDYLHCGIDKALVKRMSWARPN